MQETWVQNTPSMNLPFRVKTRPKVVVGVWFLELGGECYLTHGCQDLARK